MDAGGDASCPSTGLRQGLESVLVSVPSRPFSRIDFCGSQSAQSLFVSHLLVCFVMSPRDPDGSLNSGHAPKLTVGHICHVALYVWTSTMKPDTNNFSWELFTPGLKKIANGPYMKTPYDGPDIEDARQFLEQAIMRPNRQERLIDQFHCTIIMYEYLDGALAEFLKICHTMLDLCPQILQSCSNYTRGRLRDACSIACQRTLCSGGMKDDTFVYEVTELSMDLMS